MNMTRSIPEYAEYQDRLKGSTTVKPSSPQKVGNQLPGGVYALKQAVNYIALQMVDLVFLLD